jgi:hypothetical protein
MLRPACSETDFSAEMIGAALFLRKQGFPCLVVHPRAVGVPLAVILSGQHTTRQRRPSHYPRGQSFRHGNQFGLDRPFNEAVFGLLRSAVSRIPRSQASSWPAHYLEYRRKQFEIMSARLEQSLDARCS